VLAALEGFNPDHQALTDLYLKNVGPFPPDEEWIDAGIKHACESKANNFRPSDSEIGLITMVFGKAIMDTGSDVVTYVGELMARDRKIAALVDCP
jgi:hypothetical protein